MKMNIEESITRRQQDYGFKQVWLEKINEYCKKCSDYGYGCRGLKNKDSEGKKCDCYTHDID